MKDVSTLGIDLAKNRFRVVGLNKVGKVEFRKWLYRDELLAFMSNVTKCVVGMEACAGSHYWGREFEKLGHEVKLMPPQYVKPYVKTHKNDTTDAEACAEAVTRASMRFVPIKSEGQQELLQIHAVRRRLVRERTALGNEMRGFLGEFGVVFAQGLDKLVSRVQEVLAEEGRLSSGTQALVLGLIAELEQKNELIAEYDRKIEAVHKASQDSQRLDVIPGIGELTSTALVGAFSSVEQFKSGRQFAAFLGLVPKQHSTGGKARLGRISKHGNEYLRGLFIQGAQSVLQSCRKKNDPYSLWVQKVYQRRGWCRTVIAIANKNARIAWAVLARGVSFDPCFVPQPAVAHSKH